MYKFLKCGLLRILIWHVGSGGVGAYLSRILLESLRREEVEAYGCSKARSASRFSNKDVLGSRLKLELSLLPLSIFLCNFLHGQTGTYQAVEHADFPSYSDWGWDVPRGG